MHEVGVTVCEQDILPLTSWDMMDLVSEGPLCPALQSIAHGCAICSLRSQMGKGLTQSCEVT